MWKHQTIAEGENVQLAVKRKGVRHEIYDSNSIKKAEDF